MKIYEVSERSAALIAKLLEVWEKSVRATHLFLADEEVRNIKNYVPQALSGIAHLLIAENEEGTPVAFMGVEDGSLEMLFITPQERGKGLGKRLICCGIENYGVERLAVNEQNPHGVQGLQEDRNRRAGEPLSPFIYEPGVEAQLGEGSNPGRGHQWLG